MMSDQSKLSSEAAIRLLYLCTMPPPEGGVRVLVRMLAQSMEQDSRFDLTLFDLTVRRNPVIRTLIYLRMMFEIFSEIKRCDAVLFAAPGGTYQMTVGVVVYWMARLRDTPIIFRHFGGDNAKRFSSRPLYRFVVKRTSLRADLLFFETKYDVEYFRALRTLPVAWFSNNRPVPAEPKATFSERASKFIYLGLVNEEKGIKVLIDAIADVEGDVRVDIYGNDLMEVESFLPPNGSIHFLGPVENADVYETLSKYDALILPSFREGYPGVIIEAFLVGLPVIATRLPGICEIVIEDVTGCLVEPGNVEQLSQAIMRLNRDEQLYKELIAGVREHSFGFSSEYWHESFVGEIGDLVARHRSPSAR
jgi:glycosyltransferase involved in cell wall biosynthesis